MDSNWLWFGAILMVAELLLPGLVVVFVGLGAVTVAGLLHLGFIESLAAQFSTWFISSMVYTLTLRTLIVRFLPTETNKQEIDEDVHMLGESATVVEAISTDSPGRISHGDTTWPAQTNDEQPIPSGATVQITARENITWIVTTNKEETS